MSSKRLCGGGSKSDTALLQLGRILLLLVLTFVLASHLHAIQSVHGQSAASTTFDRWTSCVTTVTEIIDRELQYSSTYVPRLHIVCPGTFWEISYLDHYRQDLLLLSNANNNNNNNQGDVQPMIPLRSNMILRCGDNGLSENSCIVSDGYIQLDGTSLFASQFANTDAGTNNTNSTTTTTSSQNLNNIVIEGLTFVGGRHAKQSLLAQYPGSITFKSCIWRDFTKALVPIMLDYYDPYQDSNPTTATDELVVTFQDCLFEDNQYFGTESHPALIVGNGEQNRIVIETTIFQYNDMIYNNTLNSTHSFLIQSLGPVCLDRTCFIDNYVGAANVAMFGNTLTSSQIFVSNAVGGDLDIEFFDGIEDIDDDDQFDGGNMTNATDIDELPTSLYSNVQQGLCDFAASFQTLDQYERMRPICIQATASTCSFALQSTTSAVGICATPEPTSAPTTIESATTTSPSPTAPIPGAEFNTEGGD
mmetsp:Transcript_60640/g.148770  ORF Transcript_60640/g.148770 Transcript_60640/m.148770 type:complete len:476 (-) Transcript_60640:93-1520(-)